MRTYIPMLPALAVLIAALSGCGQTSSPEASSTTGTTASASSTSSTPVPSVSVAGAHNDADVQFAQQMIPHHAQAIEMSKMAENADASIDVQQLALHIEQTQQPEIDQMIGWLAAWGASAAPAAGAEHEADAHAQSDTALMPGMMSETDMQGLTTAKGAAFDRMFLTMMIRHHQGAIDMANSELTAGTNPQALALARSIRSTQQVEVKAMQQLLTKP